MSSTPKCLQNPILRLVKIHPSGPLVCIERLGEQHYLVWRDGTPVTEVQCVPTQSGRWYYRGGGLCWAKTRQEAIVSGRIRRMKGVRLNGKPLEPWTNKAAAAIARATGAAS